MYDFAGEGRNDSPASYYLNTGGLPGGMSWVVKRGNEAEKNADTNDNMKNMLKSDGVGITNYKFGAKYPRVDSQTIQVKQKNFLIHQPLHMKCSM